MPFLGCYLDFSQGVTLTCDKAGFLSRVPYSKSPHARYRHKKSSHGPHIPSPGTPRVPADVREENLPQGACSRPLLPCPCTDISRALITSEHPPAPRVSMWVWSCHQHAKLRLRNLQVLLSFPVLSAVPQHFGGIGRSHGNIDKAFLSTGRPKSHAFEHGSDMAQSKLKVPQMAGAAQTEGVLLGGVGGRGR